MQEYIRTHADGIREKFQTFSDRLSDQFARPPRDTFADVFPRIDPQSDGVTYIGNFLRHIDQQGPSDCSDEIHQLALGTHLRDNAHNVSWQVEPRAQGKSCLHIEIDGVGGDGTRTITHHRFSEASGTVSLESTRAIIHPNGDLTWYIREESSCTKESDGVGQSEESSENQVSLLITALLTQRISDRGDAWFQALSEALPFDESNSVSQDISAANRMLFVQKSGQVSLHNPDGYDACDFTPFAQLTYAPMHIADAWVVPVIRATKEGNSQRIFIPLSKLDAGDVPHIAQNRMGPVKHQYDYSSGWLVGPPPYFTVRALWNELADTKRTWLQQGIYGWVGLPVEELKKRFFDPSPDAHTEHVTVDHSSSAELKSQLAAEEIRIMVIPTERKYGIDTFAFLIWPPRTTGEKLDADRTFPIYVKLDNGRIDDTRSDRSQDQIIEELRIYGAEFIGFVPRPTAVHKADTEQSKKAQNQEVERLAQILGVEIRSSEQREVFLTRVVYAALGIAPPETSTLMDIGTATVARVERVIPACGSCGSLVGAQTMTLEEALAANADDGGNGACSHCGVGLGGVVFINVPKTAQ